jgi:lysozyme
MADYIKGLDLSSIQGSNIDWAQLYSLGYRFVFIRACIGNDFNDTDYVANMKGAQAAGLKSAPYLFLYPLCTDPNHPNRDPKDQAALHYKFVGNTQAAAIDLEWPYQNQWKTWGIDANFITQWLLTYLQEYERLSGVRPIIYSYPSFLEALNLPQSFADDYKLWIASYTATPVVPKPWNDWAFWQQSGGTEKLPNGIPVDIDVAKDLSLWDAAFPITPPIVMAPANPIPPTVPTVPVAPVVPTPPVSSSNWLQNLWNIFLGLFK